MTITFDPALAHTLEVLALAERHLTSACEQLGDAGRQAAPLAGDTNWQTRAATRFHAAAQEWCADVNALSALAEAARDDVRRAVSRIEAAQFEPGLFDPNQRRFGS